MKITDYKNFIIYGAGASGVLLKRLIDENSSNVVAFIDDNINLNGRVLSGIEIVHSSSFNEEFIQKHNIEAIIVSNLEIHINKSQDLLKYNLPLFLPDDVKSWNYGIPSNVNISQVDPGFIIGRNVTTHLDEDSLTLLNGKTILITGACGSIGSEIVRQLGKSSDVRLILADIDESGLHDLALSLPTSLNVSFKVCDVSNFLEAQRLFMEFKNIDKVFHAAAYKHVPIVELDPYPAIRVNIIGTKNVCELSEKFNVSDFTLVSTDKAVNPTNLMGASKRCAELIAISYNARSNKNFRCTRFGNVFGSRGSVLPRFIDQIRKSESLTITHSEITRYFMTIPEASQLVINSSLIDNDGGIFVFDMGEPVKILDIILRLKTYFQVESLPVEIIGLREGEKMYEELNGANELLTRTENHKIFKIPFSPIDSNVLSHLELFLAEYNFMSISEIKKNMAKILPEYHESI